MVNMKLNLNILSIPLLPYQNYILDTRYRINRIINNDTHHHYSYHYFQPVLLKFKISYKNIKILTTNSYFQE